MIADGSAAVGDGYDGHRRAFKGFLADIGIVFSFRWTGAALACGVMGFPLLVRAIRLSFEAIDRKLEDMAERIRLGQSEQLDVIAAHDAIRGMLVDIFM